MARKKSAVAAAVAVMCLSLTLIGLLLGGL
jgi:hypothetical protein